MTEQQFPTDAATVDSRTQNSASKIEQLKRAKRPPLLRLNNLFGAAVPSKKPPTWKALPARVADDARRLGFKPVCKLLWGHWPLPFMRQPQFIGPEGFVKLECYKGTRCYLNTMFDDGSGISTAPGKGGNANTLYLTSLNNFDDDYRAHLDAVRDRVDTQGASPIYRSTGPAIAHSMEVFYLYQCPTALAMVLMFQTWAVVGMIVYSIIILAT